MTGTEKAFGKLNLLLDVPGKRPDGYHEMKMVMQTVSLCDEVTLETGAAEDCCVCDVPGVPSGTDNLALRAAKAFYEEAGIPAEKVRISIRKSIPMQGGMAGGSADAAAVLRLLNRMHGGPLTSDALQKTGLRLGSDVPYCLVGGTKLAEGRGEVLSALPALPDCAFVLLKPEFSVSTPWLFGKLDEASIPHRPDFDAAADALRKRDLDAFCRQTENVFQPVLSACCPQIETLCRALRERGALSALLTGTGSVVFGIFRTLSQAETAAEAFRREKITAYTAKTV